ncbi:MAG: glycoside hydrolase family 43 protein, partial [Eubacterium sp.]|nr:glycoside hydrolase family 43 protein [Eubacterium sp.]
RETNNSSQAIRFGVSEDGEHFYPLNANDPVITQTGGTFNCRDPYLFRGQDGYYYIIATDQTYHNGGWGKLTSTLVLWRSRDLVNWSDETHIDIHDVEGCGQDDRINYAWAPQVIWDEVENKYMIYFAFLDDKHTETDYGYNRQMMYYCYATNLFDVSTWEEPQCLYDPGMSSAAIDGDIICQDDVFYMFFKDETRGGICLATSDCVNGPYSFVGKFDSGSVDSGALEGCQVYKVGNDYYLVADRYAQNGHFAIYNLGDDLSAINETSGLISVSDGNPVSVVDAKDGFVKLEARHGSFTPISKAQYTALVNEYGVSTNEDITYHFSSGYEFVNATNNAGDMVNNYLGMLDGGNLINYFIKGDQAAGHHGRVVCQKGSGYVGLNQACAFINEDDVRKMFLDNVYTVTFEYTRLRDSGTDNAVIFSIATDSTEYICLKANGEFYVNGDKKETATIKDFIQYSFAIVSDGTNITLVQDGTIIWSGAATITFPTSGTRYASIGGNDTTGLFNAKAIYSKLRFRNYAISTTQAQGETAFRAPIWNYNEGTDDNIDGRNNVKTTSSSIA